MFTILIETQFRIDPDLDLWIDLDLRFPGRTNRSLLLLHLLFVSNRSRWRHNPAENRKERIVFHVLVVSSASAQNWRENAGFYGSDGCVFKRDFSPNKQGKKLNPLLEENIWKFTWFFPEKREDFLKLTDFLLYRMCTHDLCLEIPTNLSVVPTGAP